MVKLTGLLGVLAAILALADQIHGPNNGDIHRTYIHVHLSSWRSFALSHRGFHLSVGCEQRGKPQSLDSLFLLFAILDLRTRCGLWSKNFHVFETVYGPIASFLLVG